MAVGWTATALQNENSKNGWHERRVHKRRTLLHFSPTSACAAAAACSRAPLAYGADRHAHPLNSVSLPLPGRRVMREMLTASRRGAGEVSEEGPQGAAEQQSLGRQRQRQLHRYNSS